MAAYLCVSVLALSTNVWHLYLDGSMVFLTDTPINTPAHTQTQSYFPSSGPTLHVECPLLGSGASGTKHKAVKAFDLYLESSNSTSGIFFLIKATEQ